MHLVLTDLHGMRRETDRALNAISRAIGVDWTQCTAIILGDCIDYHPESREVMEFVSELVDPVLIAGNHEDVLMTALKEGAPSALTAWLTAFDGASTLRSYGIAERVSIAGDYAHLDGRPVRTQEDIRWFLNQVFTPKHLALLERMQFKHLDGDILYCHGGLLADRPPGKTVDWYLVWGSEEWHNAPYHKAEGYRVVYGHWHQEVHPVFGRHRICLALEGRVAVFCPEAKLVVTSDGVFYRLHEDWTVADWG